MIAIEHMCCGYQDRPVLFCEHALFPAGKVTGIIGANGSGKSTLLRTIEGLVSYKGSITIDGKESARLTQKERACLISYLPQASPAVNLTVRELVSHGRFAHLGISRILSEKDRRIVQHAMEQTDVSHLAGRTLKEISGGERQRAFLAMAIAQEAKMMLLDEPTTGLDIGHQKEVMNILKDLAGKGIGIIMTLHDIPEAFTVSDHLVLIGREAADTRSTVLATGTPDEILHQQEILKKCVGTGIVRTCIPGQLVDYVLVNGSTEETGD